MCLKLRSVNVDGIWVQDPRRGKTIRYVSTVRIGQIYTVCKYSTCVSAEKLVMLVTRCVSKLLKAKLTTLATNVNDVLEVAKRQRRRYLGSRS